MFRSNLGMNLFSAVSKLCAWFMNLMFKQLIAFVKCQQPLIPAVCVSYLILWYTTLIHCCWCFTTALISAQYPTRPVPEAPYTFCNIRTTMIYSPNTGKERWWVLLGQILLQKWRYAHFWVWLNYISCSNTAHYIRKHRALPTFSYEHFDTKVTKHTKSVIHWKRPKGSIPCMQKTNEYTLCISKLERNLTSGNF